ncbi:MULTISPECIES: hypothetical protein [unclassified Streptosporangium]|uniref:hypothetical protein n=1 Tax=unclassified Streptosporangium TaxID=2632669 RepID=UPI002E2DF87C|nr:MULTISPECIES: hypothetical protein [unclassified Streptosporangium]
MTSVVGGLVYGLEGLHGGFGPAPFRHRMPIDFGAAEQTFLREHGISFGIARSVAGRRVVVERAFADAGARPRRRRVGGAAALRAPQARLRQ